MTFCLITGGAGFIGSNIVAELVKRDEQVRVLDNFATGKRENLSPFLDNIELVEGDLQDHETVRRAVEGVDVILHQGALPSVPRSVNAPLTTNEVNVTGTLNLLIAARYAGVQRVVYASSSSVYGNAELMPKRESMALAPLSPYAVSKLAGEHYCRAFYAVYGLETVCLRYFNVFGPHQDPLSQYAAVVPRFIVRMLRGESPVIYGDGNQSRDFTFVDNVVHANLLAATAPGVAGEVFNIACGERHTVLQLVSLLNDVLDTAIEPVLAAPRSGDVRHSQADIAMAQERLGYKPTTDFEEGLRRTVDWYKARGGEV
jgi:nucleoside-diphosphate-sugar epimerase